MTAATAAQSQAKSSTDQVTLIQPTGRSCHLTKVFQIQPDGLITEVEPTYKPKHFTTTIIELNGLADLLPILQEGDPRTAILRALPKRKGTITRTRNHFTQQSHHWFQLDLDGLDLPHHIDLVANPEQGARHALAQLVPHWPELACADFIWNLSRSCGIKPGLRCNLWFWASEPLSNRRLKHKVNQVNKAAGRQLIDPALFNQRQLHYTAHPILQGFTDPFPTRCGLVLQDGHLDAASVKPSAAPTPNPFHTAHKNVPRTHECNPRRHHANTPYIAAIVRGVFRSLQDDSDGRKKRLFNAAVRLASLMYDPDLVAALEQLGHTEQSLIQDLTRAGVAAGLTPERAQLDAMNGWARGLRERANEPSLWRRRPSRPNPSAVHEPQQPESEPSEDEPLTINQARVQLDHIVSTLKPRDSYILSGPPGVGKSTAKFKAALGVRPGELIILVEKDRNAVLTSHDQLPGSVYLLGKSGAGALPVDWSPHHTDDGDLSTCGNPRAWRNSRLGGTSHSTCAGCAFEHVCTHGAPDGTLGTRGQLRQATELLTTGGVIITTASMFRTLIDRYNARTDGARVPIDQIWFDDLPHPPGESILTPNRLRDSVQLLTDTDQKAALIDLIQRIERYQDTADLGEHGAFESISDTRKHLTGLNTRALTAATQTDGVPLALKTLAQWLNLDQPTACAFLVCDPDGAPSLEVVSSPPKLPANAKLLVASATTQPAIWNAWLGRTLTTWSPNLKPDCNGLWLQSKLFHPTRITLTHIDRLAPALLRHNQVISPALEGARRVLICTHKANIDHPHWDRILDLLLGGLDHIEPHVIHWRGIHQVGSNDFSGFDAVLSLGDPFLHMGKWDRTRQTLDHWTPGAGNRLDYAREAQGWVEQLEGRLRLLEHPGRTLIHVGNTPSDNLRALQPEPSRADGQPGPPPKATAKANQWLMELPINAVGAALHNLSDAPTRSTLERLIAQDPRPTWVVQLSGQCGNQHWKADSPRQVLGAVRWLLCGGGDNGVEPKRTVVVIKDLDGHTVYSSRPRIEEEKTRGLEERSAPCSSESSEIGVCLPPPPPTEQPCSASDEPGLLDKLSDGAKSRLLWLASAARGSISRWTVSAAVGLPTWMMSAELYKEAAAHLVEHGHEAGQLVGG